ncbi:MAG: cytochrome c peroxidase, partial [Burkholderiaceae bacterium]
MGRPLAAEAVAVMPMFLTVHDSSTKLAADLRRAGMTGNIESTLEARLGRKVDAKLADLGRRLFFDTAGGLNDDNTCADCHAPAAGFGDTQSI